MMRLLLTVLVLMAAACSRGPDQDALKKQLQGQIDKTFKPGLLELTALKRQGSSPQSAGQGGAERVLVYYNATLKLKEGYDFKDWEGLSPATLAQVLGGREKGVIGVKAKENQPGDLLYVYGSGTFERSGSGWTAVTGQQRDVSPAPADPGNAAAATQAKRYLDRLASVIDVAPPGIGARDDAIVSEELDRALRAIDRRRARAKDLLTFAGGPSGGEYARVVDAILGTLSKNQRRRAHVLGVETEGSIENALLIGRGQADYALVQSDVAWLATSGGGPFAIDGAQTRLAALGSLYPEPVHLVVAADSAIRSVEDLRGKRVDLGTPQSGTRLNALAVLEAYRMAAKDVVAQGDGPRASLHKLRAGQIDAFFTTIGAPARDLQRLAASYPLRLVPLSPAAAARLIAQHQGMVRLTLPANTYPGQREPVATVAATALLVAGIDTPEDEVKALLELAFESTDYLVYGSAQGVKISKASGLRGIAIPLHPAAAEYFGKPDDAKPAAKPKPAAKK